MHLIFAKSLRIWRKKSDLRSAADFEGIALGRSLSQASFVQENGFDFTRVFFQFKMIDRHSGQSDDGRGCKSVDQSSRRAPKTETVILLRLFFG